MLVGYQTSPQSFNDRVFSINVQYKGFLGVGLIYAMDKGSWGAKSDDCQNSALSSCVIAVQITISCSS